MSLEKVQILDSTTMVDAAEDKAAVPLELEDQTIIAVAIPAIAIEFSGLSQISWVASAYFLTATGFIPTWGQLSNILGRKTAFLIAVSIFELGSAMCGAAPSLTFLIVSRAIAGLGGGGIFIPIEKRSSYLGIIGGCFGIASVAGPLLGGTFLPIGAITVLVIVVYLNLGKRSSSFWDGVKRIDVMGSLLLVAAVACLVLCLVNGGTVYAWNSGFVIGFFVAAGVLIVLFVIVELRFAVEPVLPFGLLTNVSLTCSILASFFFGMTFFVLINYLPYYYQIVDGDSATTAGLRILPFILGVVFASIVSGGATAVTGWYWPFFPIGGALVITGAVLTSTLDEFSGTAMQIGYLLLAGVGGGALIQTLLIAAQASAKTEDDVPTATALSNFGQTLGAVVGIAICANVFNNQTTTGINNYLSTLPAAAVAQLPPAEAILGNVGVLQFITPPYKAGYIHAIVGAVQLNFKLAAGFAALALLLSLFIKKSKLTGAIALSPA
ncbi:hypothetical protein SmJEL517_g03590 [Synchytrium microbalum]|uniref:Major facilitator superfamily (MFS) profile domain-containing protein n=1 Tax=Synchytrium microbalum TaxID=1806994 RepID=A0A507C2K1_9FUNG|nr:uncharacterized protein SmJEL517_g03590 [Synchytrium microbalum]TPX33651.1 hypothetical protein SmJEL517_g03590 [Synchytrium microbalum]